MTIKLGNSDIAKYYVGNTQASKIYLGSNLLTTPAITFPTPPFGSANLRMWLDTNKTWSDILGGSQPSMYTDAVGYNSVSALVDLSGNGFSFTQGNKTNQPLTSGTGGVLFSPTNAFMQCVRNDLMNGLTKFSLYTLIRPLAGTSKRALLSVSEGSGNQIPLSFTIATGGALYAVNDYITLTGGAILKVLAVDGGGAVTSAELSVPTGVATAPTNPVAQTSTTRPYGTATGTGFTCNMIYTDDGSGSTTSRFTSFFSSGNTGRKNYTEISVKDGAVVLTSTTNGTSLGDPNGAVLTDTTTFHKVGVEVDLTGGTASASFYKNNALDGSVQTWTPAESTPWRLGNADSIRTWLGLGVDTTSATPMLCELKAMVLIADTLDTTRRNLINTYLSGL